MLEYTKLHSLTTVVDTNSCPDKVNLEVFEQIVKQY